MITLNKNTVPFFSVIICTYNREALLPRAIDSLLAQSEEDWEALIIDDGSTDGTTLLAKDYVARHPAKFRYVYHANKGLPLSRNAGLLAAAGLYATFLDSDDEYAPSHLSIRKKALLQNPDVDLLHGGIKIIGNEFVPDVRHPGNMIHISECTVGGTFCIRKKLAEALGGFRNVGIGDDFDFFNRAVSYGATTGKIDFPTYIYHRDTPDSLCSKQ